MDAFESASNIRVFLANILPYYESEDKDDFLYIAKGSDIETISLELFKTWQASAKIHEAKERERIVGIYNDRFKYIVGGEGTLMPRVAVGVRLKNIAKEILADRIESG